MNCTVCGSGNAVPAFHYDEFQLLRCRECSHLWVEGSSSADARYDSTYYTPGTQEAQHQTGYDDYLRTQVRLFMKSHGKMT